MSDRNPGWRRFRHPHRPKPSIANRLLQMVLLCAAADKVKDWLAELWNTLF